MQYTTRIFLGLHSWFFKLVCVLTLEMFVNSNKILATHQIINRDIPVSQKVETEGEWKREKGERKNREKAIILNDIQLWQKNPFF